MALAVTFIIGTILGMTGTAFFFWLCKTGERECIL